MTKKLPKASAYKLAFYFIVQENIGETLLGLLQMYNMFCRLRYLSCELEKTTFTSDNI